MISCFYWKTFWMRAITCRLFLSTDIYYSSIIYYCNRTYNIRARNVSSQDSKESSSLVDVTDDSSGASVPA